MNTKGMVFNESSLPPGVKSALVLRSLIFLSFFVFIAVASSHQAYSQTITYTYDTGVNGIGRLSSVTDPTGSAAFSYDPRGNVTQAVKVIEGNSFTVQNSYDSLNRVKTITYPDNEVVSYLRSGGSVLHVKGCVDLRVLRTNSQWGEPWRKIFPAV